MKNPEFVTAATALGAAESANLVRHVLPNALAPMIVTATVSLGMFIVAEATLSFLGLGLPRNVDVAGATTSPTAQNVRCGPTPVVLFYPAAALAITVLSFILLGDAVREALDPKARKR